MSSDIFSRILIIHPSLFFFSSLLFPSPFSNSRLHSEYSHSKTLFHAPDLWCHGCECLSWLATPKGNQQGSKGSCLREGSPLRLDIYCCKLPKTFSKVEGSGFSPWFSSWITWADFKSLVTQLTPRAVGSVLSRTGSQKSTCCKTPGKSSMSLWLQIAAVIQLNPPQNSCNDSHLEVLVKKHSPIWDSACCGISNKLRWDSTLLL